MPRASSIARRFSAAAQRVTPPIVTCTAAFDKKTVTLGWKDGTEDKFSSIWLRDNCLQFATASHRKYAIVGKHDQVSNARVLKDGSLSVEWADNHASVFPSNYLRRYRRERVSNVKTGLKPRVITASIGCPTAQYDEIMNDEDALLDAMSALNDLGVITIKGCPVTKEGAEDVVTKFCEVPAYIPLYGYGSDYFCGSEKNETQKACPQCFCNIPNPIEMHQDFAYFEDIPGLFFNLAMRIDEGIVGGRNTCQDVFHVAESLRVTDPEAFETLSTVECTFAKTALNSNRPVKTSVDRPIIKLSPSGQIVDVVWSLMYLRTQKLDPDSMEKFALARESFKSEIERLGAEGYEVPTPMEKGDCTILNNKRMMHGRLPFASVDGIRQHYQCYGLYGLFLNRFKVMESKRGDVFHIHKNMMALSVETD